MTEFNLRNSNSNLCTFCGESDELTLQGFLHCQSCIQKIHLDLLDAPINRSFKQEFKDVKNGYSV